MATFRYQLLPTPWPAHNLVRNREFTECTDLAGQNRIQAEEITINWLSRIDTMLTRTVFWIDLWIFGKKEF